MNNQPKGDSSESPAVPNYDGLYTISKDGTVTSKERQIVKGDHIATLKEKILKHRVDKDGYLYVGLSRDSKVNNFKIHRLLATVWIPNPENKPCVNHIDGNKMNNSLDNLEWVTHKENEHHSRVNKFNTQNYTSVSSYKDGKLVKTYPSLVAVHEEGYNERVVWRIVSGHKDNRGYCRYTHGGLKWKRN